MYNSNELIFWNAFAICDIFNIQEMLRIRKKFHSLEYGWSARNIELLACRIDPKKIQRFFDKRKLIAPEKEFEKMQKYGVSITTFIEDDYPKSLKNIFSPPPVLYWRGTLPKNVLCVGIVGTRKYSEYGKQITKNITQLLCNHSIHIVSGLALGIDGFAHQMCVDLQKPTTAVLGSGVEKSGVTPRLNFELSEKIIAYGGCILSEFPPETQPLKQNFPRRNRVIAGLCRGLVVTEAPLKSGAMITAYNALEQGRDVFSVPGSILNESYEGTNKLIQQGALVVTKPHDILDFYEIQYVPKDNEVKIVNDYKPKTLEEVTVVNLLSKKPYSLDEMVRVSNTTPSIIRACVSLLEVRGVIKNIGNNTFEKI